MHWCKRRIWYGLPRDMFGLLAIFLKCNYVHIGFRIQIHIVGHTDNTVGLKMTVARVVMVIIRGGINSQNLPPVGYSKY